MNHSPKDEYDQLMELYRYYGNVRFATLTLFAAIVAGLFIASYGSNPALPQTLKMHLQIGDAIATATFWIMELSAVFVWLHCTRRAVELENIDLKFRILSTMRGAPRFYFLPTTYAVSGFYFASLLFWILALVRD